MALRLHYEAVKGINRAALLCRFVIFAGALWPFAELVMTPALAEIDCDHGALCCYGDAGCKKLEMSGQCNGPITCGSPGKPCGCVAKAQIRGSTIKAKQPLGKSQN
jgi:hypothetical protein